MTARHGVYLYVIIPNVNSTIQLYLYSLIKSKINESIRKYIYIRAHLNQCQIADCAQVISNRLNVKVYYMQAYS